MGLNLKGMEPTGRLVERPAGNLCRYRVKVTDVSQADDELVGWRRRAYESAA